MYHASETIRYSGVPNILIPLVISVFIVLNTMIGSFRGATDNWLQQRLAAQLFLRDAGRVIVVMVVALNLLGSIGTDGRIGEADSDGATYLDMTRSNAGNIAAALV